MSLTNRSPQIRLGRGFKTDSENYANQIRSDLGLARHDRLNARVLAKHLGIKVRYPHELPSVAKANLLGLGQESGKQSWSAVFLKVEGHCGLILTNPNHSTVREESNIFHELAHSICGHKPIKITTLGGLPFREFDEEQENQAEHLGYALHLNKDSLFHSVKRGLAPEDISERYCASSQLVRYRMNLTQVNRILRR